jgi:SnoaL-like domain
MTAEIEENKRRFFHSLAGGDAAAAAEIYLEDATLVTPTGDVIRGRAGIERFWRSGLEVGLHGAELDVERAAYGDGLATPDRSVPVLRRRAGVNGAGAWGLLARRQTHRRWLLEASCRHVHRRDGEANLLSACARHLSGLASGRNKGRYPMTHLRPPRRRTLIATLATALTVGALMITGTGSAAEQTEHIYADGNTYTINTEAAVDLDASAGAIAQAAPFFIIGFPVPAGTTGPITLPSGYQPQNNGLPAPLPYHDHIAADVNNPLRRVVELQYGWAYAYSPSFAPLTSVDQLPAAEASGKLEIVAPGAPDPYQHWTNTVLVRPIVP